MTRIVHIPLAEHSTLPAELRGPVTQGRSVFGFVESTQAMAPVAYLLAQPLHVTLGQLLAAHEALDPAIKGRNCCRL